MQEALATAGFRVVAWSERADVRVVNTCTVTARSDRTCRHEIHAARRRDPHCLLAVTGCLAQVSPETAGSIEEVDLVLGILDKRALAEHLAAALRLRADSDVSTHAQTAVCVTPYPERPAFETDSFAHFHGRTRAFLKVQTGCDSRCSYCIVSRARGPARSMAQADVLEQVQLLSAQGYREIVLTGIDLGSWGRDNGEGTLADLLTAVLSDASTTADTRVAPLGRLRLSSVEPLEVDTALLDVMEQAGERVAHHFHLPLQSGSDAVLTRMKRPYTAAEYLAVTKEVANRLPDAAIGADVIVGFPGETEAEFADTLALVEASPLTYLHVFAYSDRPGTAAAEMQPKVKPEIIKERSERLRLLGTRKKEAFLDSLVGSEQRVLVLEETADDGRLIGLTSNYLEVLVDHDDDLVNRFIHARLDRALPDSRLQTTILSREG